MNERTAHGVLVLEPTGRLTTVDDGAQRMRQRVTNAFDQGQSKVLINLSGVPHMDSGALGELVRCSLAARRTKSSIRLFGLTGRVVELLTITKLVTEFDTYATEQEALDSFLVTA
jgi:anti-sigma B factor antagonist